MTRRARRMPVRLVAGMIAAAALFASGVAIAPVAAATATASTSAATATATLSGMVTGPSRPGSTVDVWIWHVDSAGGPGENRTRMTSVSPNSSGRWSVDLEPGDYLVQAVDYSGVYASQFFPGIETADPYDPAVRIITAQTGTADLNFALQPNPVLSGAISYDGEPSGGDVTIYAKFGARWDSIGTVRPRIGEGTWSMPVPPGEYRAALSGNGVSQVYDGHLGISPTASDAAVEHIRVVDRDVTGIDFDVVPLPRISGVVTDLDGAPVADANVQVWRWDGGWREDNSRSTKQDGTFVVGSFAKYGTRIAVSIEGEKFRPWYSGGDSALPRQPGDPGTYAYERDDIDLGAVAVRRIPHHTLSGEVSGAERQTTFVKVFAADDDYRTGWRPSGLADADDDGHWSVSVPNGTYRVRFNNYETHTQLYDGIDIDGQSEVPDAPGVRDIVVDGQDVGGINATLRPHPRVTVKAIDALTREPLHAWLTYYRWDPDVKKWDYLTSDEAVGDLSIQLIHVGVLAEYGDSIMFRLSAEGHHDLYSNGTSAAPNAPGDAGVFEIGNEHIDLGTKALERIPVSSVSGTVAGSAPMASGYVSAYAGSSSPERWELVTQTRPDERGRWSIELPAGRYRFTYSDDGEVLPQGYDGVTLSPDLTVWSPELATVEVNGFDTISGIDFAPTPLTTTTGTVKRADGTPIRGAEVTLWVWNRTDWHARRSADTRTDGSFSLRLEPGRHAYLSVAASGFATSYIAPGVDRAPTAPGEEGTFVVDGDRSLGVVTLVRTYISGDVSISGGFDSGELHAVLDDWPTGVDFDYRWYRGYSSDGSDGVRIDGAGGPIYPLTPDDHGAVITARVHATRPGYADCDVASSPRPMPLGTFDLGQPRIEGAAVVGSSLVAAPPSVTPVDSSLWVEWIRDGERTGVIGSEFVLTPLDVGARFSVEITATRAGFIPRSVRSESTAPAEGVFAIAPRPTIAGKAKVGRTLRAQPGAWSPKADFAYRWRADGERIPKATERKLEVSKRMRGATLTVTVTATKEQYVSLVMTSKPTKKVK